LPLNLPTTLNILRCDDNKYLHITKKYAKRFEIAVTPNYNQKASMIQRVWKAKKYKYIMIDMIKNNNNVLHDSFKSYGDLNIINLIVQFVC